jgi:Zn-finger in Ran binding protein and others
MAPLLDRTSGTFLEITQISDLHIEATLETSATDNITGVIVPLSIIETSSISPEEDIRHTSLLSYIATGNRTVADLRATHPTGPSPTPSLPPNRALIALHVRSAPLEALGLTPLHSRTVFYLPIAWIDVRDQTYLKSKSGGYSGNGRVHVSHAPLGSEHGPKGPNSTRFNGALNAAQKITHTAVNSPTQAVKPITGMFGDWNCPECKSLVFSFRLDCFKCRTPRPVSGPHIVPRQPHKTTSKPDGDIRDGDWLCACCKGHNFANKLACFTCRTLRQQDPLDGKIGRNPVDPADPSSVPSAPDNLKVIKLMPGDWTCPSCLENVFAKRRRCYKCCTLKPR